MSAEGGVVKRGDGTSAVGAVVKRGDVLSARCEWFVLMASAASLLGRAVLAGMTTMKQ